MNAAQPTDNPGIPADLKTAAQDVAGYLKIALFIERKQYPEEDAPAGLLPALLMALAVNHTAKTTSAQAVAAIESLETRMEISLDALETGLTASGGETVEILEKLESTLNDLPEKMGADSVLIDRLAGIENELFRAANYLDRKDGAA